MSEASVLLGRAGCALLEEAARKVPMLVGISAYKTMAAVHYDDEEGAESRVQALSGHVSGVGVDWASSPTDGALLLLHMVFGASSPDEDRLLEVYVAGEDTELAQRSEALVRLCRERGIQCTATTLGSLEEYLALELGPVAIGGCTFSAYAHPELLGASHWTAIESPQPLLAALSIHGSSIMEDAARATGITGVPRDAQGVSVLREPEGHFRVLFVYNATAYLSARCASEDALRLALPMVHARPPVIIGHAGHAALHTLYRALLALDAQLQVDSGAASRMDRLGVLLDAIVRDASKNEAKLFPEHTALPLYRRHLLDTAMGELDALPLRSSILKDLVVSRVARYAPVAPDTPADALSAPEFVPLVPYLSLSDGCSSEEAPAKRQRTMRAPASAGDSIGAYYWRVQSDDYEVRRVLGRDFWRAFAQ